MNSRTFFGAVALVSVTALISTQVNSQPDKKPVDAKPGATMPADHPDGALRQPTPEQMEAGMKAWQEATAPDAHHAFLAKCVGSWETTTKMTMMGAPAGEPSKGSAEIKMALGARFLHQDFKGTMMGMAFEGVGYMGYDKFKKAYTSCWFDTLGTQMLTAIGHLDQSGKVLSLYGSMDEPMTGENDKPVKYVYRFVDANTMVFEIHDLAIGEKSQVLEVTYKRKGDMSK